MREMMKATLSIDTALHLEFLDMPVEGIKREAPGIALPPIIIRIFLCPIAIDSGNFGQGIGWDQ